VVNWIKMAKEKANTSPIVYGIDMAPEVASLQPPSEMHESVLKASVEDTHASSISSAVPSMHGLAQALKDAGAAMQKAGVHIMKLEHTAHLNANELPMIEFHIEAYFDGKSPEIAYTLHALYAWANNNYIPF